MLLNPHIYIRMHANSLWISVGKVYVVIAVSTEILSMHWWIIMYTGTCYRSWCLTFYCAVGLQLRIYYALRKAAILSHDSREACWHGSSSNALQHYCRIYNLWVSHVLLDPFRSSIIFFTVPRDSQVTLVPNLKWSLCSNIWINSINHECVMRFF